MAKLRRTGWNAANPGISSTGNIVEAQAIRMESAGRYVWIDFGSLGKGKVKKQEFEAYLTPDDVFRAVDLLADAGNSIAQKMVKAADTPVT